MIRGPLFLLPRIRWNENLATITESSLLARCEVSPGIVIGRPCWPSPSYRDRWLKATAAMELNEGDLDDQTREQLRLNDWM